MGQTGQGDRDSNAQGQAVVKGQEKQADRHVWGNALGPPPPRYPSPSGQAQSTPYGKRGSQERRLQERTQESWPFPYDMLGPERCCGAS